jgi:putative effector of murein hydrolase
MKSFILASLTTLALATVVAPAAQATPKTAINPYVAGNELTNKFLNPASLVALANQGYFQAEGIPSNTLLVSEYRLGRVTAQDLVNAAVKTNRLPADVVNEGYINAVDTHLQNIYNGR